MFVAKVAITAVTLPMMVVTYLIGFVASWFVTLGGTLTNWALDINSTVLTSITVKTGWIVSRDLANLGFVLAIILIAFITILRYQSYDTKKMLVRLISAALLINFSLVIAGVFIDFSGLLTNFFLSKATNGHIEQIGPGLVGSMRAHELFQQKADEATVKNQIEGMGGDFNKIIVFISTQIFIGLFTIITAISLLSLAIMLYIRYIALTILLILMPIAWLMWIWPDLEGYWSSWWKEFMKWCFFAPSMSFFIYLAFQIALTYKNTSGSWVGSPVTGTETMANLIQNFGSILGQMVSVIGILYAGLYTANKMGIAGANLGITAVGMAKGYITGAPGATYGYIGSKYGMGGIDRLSTNLTGKTMNQHLQTATGKMSGWAIGGDLMQNLNKGLKSSEETSTNDMIKHYDSLSDEARLEDISSGRWDPKRQAAAIASLAKNGQLEKAKELMGDERYGAVTEMAMGMKGIVAKELTKKDPFLAEHTVKPTDSQFAGMTNSKEKEEAIAAEKEKRVNKAVSGMATEDIIKMNKESFKKFTTIARNLAQLRNNFFVASAERDDSEKHEIVKTLSDEIRKLQNSGEDPTLLRGLISKLTFIGQNTAWKGIKIDKDLHSLIGIEKEKGGGNEGEGTKKIWEDPFGPHRKK